MAWLKVLPSIAMKKSMALNRQTSRTLPMGQSESREYDQYGRLSRSVDFKGQ